MKRRSASKHHTQKDGSLCIPQRSAPTIVRWAIDSYEQAARAVAGAVFTQVLKQNDHPAVQLVLKGSTARLDLNAS